MNKYVRSVRQKCHLFWKERGIFFYVSHSVDAESAFNYCCQLDIDRGGCPQPFTGKRGAVMIPMHPDDFPKALKFCQHLDELRNRDYLFKSIA